MRAARYQCAQLDDSCNPPAIARPMSFRRSLPGPAAQLTVVARSCRPPQQNRHHTDVNPVEGRQPIHVHRMGLTLHCERAARAAWWRARPAARSCAPTRWTTACASPTRRTCPPCAPCSLARPRAPEPRRRVVQTPPSPTPGLPNPRAYPVIRTTARASALASGIDLPARSRRGVRAVRGGDGSTGRRPWSITTARCLHGAHMQRQTGLWSTGKVAMADGGIRQDCRRLLFAVTLQTGCPCDG